MRAAEPLVVEAPLASRRRRALRDAVPEVVAGPVAVRRRRALRLAAPVDEDRPDAPKANCQPPRF
jgi:hypothetical protein